MLTPIYMMRNNKAYILI